MMGEFGRTPRFNAAGGRDHWPNCFSVVLAGGGIRGGQVLRRLRPHRRLSHVRPVSPQDLMATLYHRLGVDPHTHHPRPAAPAASRWWRARR